MMTAPPSPEWPLRRLRMVTERIFLGLADTRQRGEGENAELPVVNVRDIRDGHVQPVESLAKRGVAGTAEIERYTIRTNDIVITCRGTQLKIARVMSPLDGALISANVIGIRAGTELMPAVLFAFLRSPAGQKALRQRGRSSTANISLTPDAVAELAIPLPPLSVQRQIADLVESAEQNYVAASRAAEQRRAIAHAVAVEILNGTVAHAQEDRA